MTVAGAQQIITDSVLLWTGMSAGPHRFGGVEYLYNGRREIGHIHGDSLLDIPFPRRVRDELIHAGLAQPHHLLTDSGWVSFYISEPDHVRQALELLHRSYELATRQRDKPQSKGE
jgi:Luciferase